MVAASLPGVFGAAAFLAYAGGPRGSQGSETRVLTDDQLLEAIERAAFHFFWEQANPTNGLVKDRARWQGGEDTSVVASIAATGFGLTGLCIADTRRYLPTTQLKRRALATLEFFASRAPGQNGFFYHFLDINTGERYRTSEVSPIDTSILLCGILTCRAHFQDSRITSLADQIYQRINWTWMLNGGNAFAKSWRPETGFKQNRWDSYCELMMMYLLAIAAPANAIPASCWDAFSRPVIHYAGYTYITSNASLFTHQYSHAWFDFRSKRDAYADYFQNSIIATKVEKLYCLSLADRFPDYTDDLWGVTASDSMHGYTGWGGAPPVGHIDGTVVPCATGGSVPFLPADTLAVQRNLYTNFRSTVWTPYGPVDAFNPLKNWADAWVLGIDLGISMLMAENHRSEFVWKTFMRNPEAVQAMKLVGFHQA